VHTLKTLPRTPRTPRKPRIAPALLALLAGALASTGALASGNLLVNGNAEAGAGADDGSVVAVPGWTTTSGNFTVATYNTEFSGPDASSPGPVDRGLNYFAGGPDTAFSQATQTVDLTPYQSFFSSHPFSFTLSGWFGGFAGQDDYAYVSVSFRDADNNELEFASTSPIFASDRNNITGLLFVSTGWTPDNNININPALAVITLTMTRTEGSYDDGYADNLLFSVGAVPEAGSVAMMLAGLGGMALVLRRRLR
jgi:hypothetical protein